MESVMRHGRLSPFFAVARWVMAAIMVVLAVRTIPETQPVAAIAVTALFIGLVLAGIIALRWIPRWLSVAGVWLLIVVWVVSLHGTAEMIFVAFPLFFVALALMSQWQGLVAVGVITAFAIASLGAFNPNAMAGASVGIVIAAGVAVLLAHFIKALQRDADARELLIAQLRETRAALSDAERAAAVHTERERLARDVHDTVSQSLASVGMLLHAADADASAGKDPRLRIAQAREASQSALAETRALITELTKDGAHSAALTPALERLAADAEQRADLTARVEVHGDSSSLPTHIAVALLRIAQGAVANVVRHSSASTLLVTLTVDDDATLIVEDNGHGFDAATDTGFGIRAMHDRVSELDGALTISSNDQGTTVRAQLAVQA